MPDAFSRAPDRIHAEFLVACNRKVAAQANLDAAIEAAKRADDEVLRYEWHLELIGRQITSLLDELNRSRKPETLAY